jgi:DHA1 family bicyclomycin/chloramphenicol resistance-like MFS transporter
MNTAHDHHRPENNVVQVSKLTPYVLLLITVIFGMSTDIHLPAMPDMVEDLNTTIFKVQLVLIVFAIGAIIGRLIWGPISDKYGRRKVLLLTTSIQALSQLGCAMSPNIDILILFRVLKSLGGGITSVLCVAVIADMFKGEVRAKALALQEMAFPIAFVLAPIIGAVIMEETSDWRNCFLFMVCFSTICIGLIYFLIPETLNQVHHENEVHKLYLLYIKIFHNFEFIIMNVIVGGLIAIYMIFLINAPFIYMRYFGLSLTNYAILQFTPMLFNVGATFIYGIFVHKYGVDKCLNPAVYIYTLLSPIFLSFGIGILNFEAVYVFYALCMQSAIVAFIIPGLSSKALDIYPHTKGMTASVMGSIRAVAVSIGMLAGSFLSHDFKLMFIFIAVLGVLPVSLFLILKYKEQKALN